MLCFLYRCLLFTNLQGSIREECRLSQKAKQISLWLSKQNSITHKAPQGTLFCEVRNFFVHFSMYVYELLYVLFEKINPDIAKMSAVCCVCWCVRKKAAIPKRKKNFKLSQLVDIVVVCLSYFFCYLFQIAVF